MRKVIEHKAQTFADAHEFDVQFWRRVKATARLEAVWSMVTDFQKIKGKSGGQPRLRRSIQNIEHLQD